MKYTDKQLLNRVKIMNGYKYIPPTPWIIGVRSKADAYNQFDDKFYLFKGETFIAKATGTTNPGAYSLHHFKDYGASGSAVVVSDEWYYDVWTMGMHKAKVKALIQIGSFKIQRDNNLNNKSGDAGKIQIESGIGINFHPASYNLEQNTVREKIDAWSAGCQVVNSNEEFKTFMANIPKNKKISYCLLKEF